MCLRLVVLSMPSTSINLMSSQLLPLWIASLHQGEGHWLKFTGDIANCYDELDHDRCLDGVAWGLKSLPSWLGKRQAGWFSCSKVDRKDCRLGRATSEDRVDISFEQVLEVCVFDCRNSVIFVHGKLRRRIVGAPMGGFLSAFYAILCFAFIEEAKVKPMFTKLGIPGGIRRYLDDIIAVFCCNGKIMELEAKLFMEWLASPEVYPPPLVLNVEPEGDQEFLEARVVTHDDNLCSVFRNTTAVDICEGKNQYRRRLPHAGQVREEEVQKLVQGIATRAVQMTSGSDGELLYHCLRELKLEVSFSGLPPRLFARAIHYILLKYPTENVKNAIRRKGIL